MTNDISATLQERGKRYGSFDGHAKVTQEIKFIINEALYDRQKTVTASMKEALDMIAHKIGRIVNGDPFYADSWIDIAGYAQLVADELADELDDELDDLVAGRFATDVQVADSERFAELTGAPLTLAGCRHRSVEQPACFAVTAEHKEWAAEVLSQVQSERQGGL